MGTGVGTKQYLVYLQKTWGLTFFFLTSPFTISSISPGKKTKNKKHCELPGHQLGSGSRYVWSENNKTLVL